MTKNQNYYFIRSKWEIQLICCSTTTIRIVMRNWYIFFSSFPLDFHRCEFWVVTFRVLWLPSLSHLYAHLFFNSPGKERKNVSAIFPHSPSHSHHSSLCRLFDFKQWMNFLTSSAVYAKVAGGEKIIISIWWVFSHCLFSHRLIQHVAKWQQQNDGMKWSTDSN